jgi:hypothetical protein
MPTLAIREKIIGVEHGDTLVITRCHEWTIEMNKGPLGALEFCQSSRATGDPDNPGYVCKHWRFEYLFCEVSSMRFA